MTETEWEQLELNVLHSLPVFWTVVLGRAEGIDPSRSCCLARSR